MIRLLDTNVCIAFLNSRDRALTNRIVNARPAELQLCSVVKGELLYGAHKSTRRDANLRRLEEFFGLFPSIPFDDDAAHHYGVIRAELPKKGTPIGPNDLLIASIALAAKATVVTRNHDEFRRVPGLKVEAW